MPFRSALLAVSVTLLSGCFTREIAERAGASGWFRSDLSTAQKSYRDRFAPFPLADEALSCAEVPTGGRIVVLVHGLGGDRAEMEHAFPAVLESRPSAVFLFRWVPYDGRDELVKRLANGLTHLGACAPDAEVVLVAHSAGGVLASLAASRVHEPRGFPGTWLTIMTVASPLAGTAQVPVRDDGREEAMFVLDLGHPIAAYAHAARGVRVVHLRTSPPADKFMEPVGGHMPNDPKVGVRGAVQEDLPARLTHDAALAYVTERLADGSWTEWLQGSAAATAGR